MSKVQIDINEFGMGTIIVDGVDMSKVASKAEVVVEAGQLTKITLHMVRTQVDIKAEAEVSTFQ
jgi:hypothetical protein